MQHLHCRKRRRPRGRHAGLGRSCRRCDAEAASYRYGLCPRCCLGDDLAVALDDGTDHINPALGPLHQALTAQHNPVSGILWLRNPGVGDLLHQLATGALPLDLSSFRNHPHPLVAIHLRDLLVGCGILAPIDRHTAAFKDWLAAHLPRHPAETQQLLHGFATWLGAVGEVNLRFIDDDGAPIATELDELVVGATLEQIGRAGRRIAVAGGPEKYRAIRAALRGGWTASLLTDATTARHLLDHR